MTEETHAGDTWITQSQLDLWLKHELNRASLGAGGRETVYRSDFLTRLISYCKLEGLDETDTGLIVSFFENEVKCAEHAWSRDQGGYLVGTDEAPRELRLESNAPRDDGHGWRRSPEHQRSIDLAFEAITKARREKQAARRNARRNVRRRAK